MEVGFGLGGESLVGLLHEILVGEDLVVLLLVVQVVVEREGGLLLVLGGFLLGFDGFVGLQGSELSAEVLDEIGLVLYFLQEHHHVGFADKDLLSGVFE